MSDQIKTAIKYFRIEKSEQIQSLLKPVESFAGSFGLQPFKIIVTKGEIDTDSGTKKNFRDRSAQFVFAVRKEITKIDIDEFIEEIREAKKYPTSSLASYRKIFEDSINSKNGSGITWAEKQMHTGLDILLASARQKNLGTDIDTKIDADLYDNVLGLVRERYKSVFSIHINFNYKDEHRNEKEMSRTGLLV